LQVTKRRRTRT